MPATTTAEEVLAQKPRWRDSSRTAPAIRGHRPYAVPMIQGILAHSDLPVFGILPGPPDLALALDARTIKMNHGHHGAKPPVKDQESGKVEITSM